jgi:hypothetical protein
MHVPRLGIRCSPFICFPYLFSVPFLTHNEKCLTLTNTIIRTYNVLGRFPFNVIHSRTANLGEVSSALLGAQVETNLTGLLSDTNQLVSERLMLRPTVSRSVCPGIKHPSGACDQITVWQLRSCFFFGGGGLCECPLWREDRSVFCTCCWSLPVHSFSGLSPLGLVTIFYCLKF